MKTKKIIIGLASALIVSAALPVTAQESKDEGADNMMVGGSAPQGHAIEGHSSMMNHQNMSSEHGAISDASTRNIAVTARDDMTFSPASWSFKQGEVVRFVIKNEGRINHEFVIGNKAEMQEHAKMMKAMPHMAHDQGNAVSLNPGETRDLVWRFTSSGVFEAACNVPGHYEAGMKSIITVAAR